MSEKLLPCPFCGGEHIVARDKQCFGAEVCCKQCRGAMWSGSVASAIELWNRRTPGQAMAKMLDDWRRQEAIESLTGQLPSLSKSGRYVPLDETRRILAEWPAQTNAPADGRGGESDS